MVNTIEKEIRLFKAHPLVESAVLDSNTIPQNAPTSPFIETIYFGGGTPSLLTGAELEQILQAVHQCFMVSTTAEITLETNPDDHTAEKLEDWKRAGINRLSIGVQSFFENDLRWMNRAHTAEQSIACIKAAQNKGFHNLTIDLIYGIPGLTDEQWQQNFDTAIALGIPHLSCYALTVEPKTALDVIINRGQAKPVDAAQQANQFLLLMDWAAKAGLEHYEISNFAKKGHRSKHNRNYWNGVSYFGFGPSAHSFDGDKTRWWNIANNALYLKSWAQDVPPVEKEILTATQQQNEYIMTGLRTMEGLSKKSIAAWNLPKKTMDQFWQNAAKWELLGNLHITDEDIRLTNEGKLFADGIAADLFIEIHYKANH